MDQVTILDFLTGIVYYLAGVPIGVAMWAATCYAIYLPFALASKIYHLVRGTKPTPSETW